MPALQLSCAESESLEPLDRPRGGDRAAADERTRIACVSISNLFVCMCHLSVARSVCAFTGRSECKQREGNVITRKKGPPFGFKLFVDTGRFFGVALVGGQAGARALPWHYLKNVALVIYR
jgi:hypothetical protein